MEWVITQISKRFQRDSFDCGVADQNEYLRRHARQNHDKGSARCFVAVQLERVIGYYCISMSEIAFECLPESERKGLPRYPAPSMLIGQFAVDKTYQGRGVGKELLFHAIGKAIEFSSEIGILAIRVDANSQRARDFYLKYGFKDYENNAQNGLFPLLLPMSVVLKTRSQNPVI